MTLLANKGDLPDLDILGRKIAATFDISLAAAEGAPWSETIQSPYSVKTTIERVMTIVKQQGGTLFSHINHGDEAKKTHQILPPTELIVVGNPAKGTCIMQENSAFALDLPWRIMATEDNIGQVWLSFTDPIKLAKEYGLDIKEKALFKHMSTAMKKVCLRAISAQTIL